MTPASSGPINGAPSTHSSPTRFLSLPRELQTHIFSKACYSDQTLNHLDVKTARNLMLICKDLHLVAAALLYKNVRVTRPSILGELVQTLKARPELGVMIKTLHLGAHCPLDPSWWPIENLNYWYNPRFMTSLTDEKWLPRWCDPHHDFMPKHPRYTYDHRERAVVAAVEAAQRAFGVDVDGRSWSCAPQLFGSLPWLAGVLEVQAAMDLYLIEMRRLEDDAARPKQSNDCEKCQQESSLQSEPFISYPSLQVLPNVACPPFGGRRTFVVTHKDILDHLARRGSLLDSFESPLLLARSGLQILTFDSSWQARVSPHVLQRATLLHLGGRFADSFGSPSSRRATWLLSSIAPFSAESYATSTAGGILALARTLLALSPSVQSLFITGFIQQLLCGSNRVELPSLRNLFLGPLTHAHGDSLAPTIKGTTLAALERLIIRGPHFGKQKAAAILALAQPKNVRWEMEWGEASAEDIIAAVRPLFDALGLTRETATIRGPQQEVDVRPTLEEYPSASSSGSSSSSPARSVRSPPAQVTVTINSDVEEEVTSILSEAARARLNSRDFLCETPFTLRLLFVTAIGGGNRYWHAAAGDASVAHTLLGEEWERCLEDWRVKRVW